MVKILSPVLKLLNLTTFNQKVGLEYFWIGKNQTPQQDWNS